jgi:hypothetical protein
MPQTATYPHPAKRPRIDALRMLIWIKEPHFQGFGCSACAWASNPSGPPAGNSLEEMKEHYKRRRDQEFSLHRCAEHLKLKKSNLPSSLPCHRPISRVVSIGRRNSSSKSTPRRLDQPPFFLTQTG